MVGSRGCNGSTSRPPGRRHSRRGGTLSRPRHKSLGSVSKVFTALAVVQLAASGDLSLEEAVSSAVGFEVIQQSPGWRPVTIADLLTHRGGLLRNDQLPGSPPRANPAHPRVYADKWPTPPDLDRFFADGIRADLPPGERWNYSNLGYGILGLVIQHRSGLSYETYLRDRVFAPLGMAGSGLTADYGSLDVYELDVGEQRLCRLREFLLAPAGGVTSTLSDLAEFGRALLARNLPGIDDHHFELMTTPQASRENIDPFSPIAGHMGYGWWIDDGLAHHAGGLGHVADVWLGNSTRTVAIALTNNFSSITADIARRVIVS